jgi:prepilin-type N-terminal cleavage/methylation domain-containing protein
MKRRQAAFTLLEILLVVGILAVLAGLAMPRLMQDLEAERLPQSCNQMRALLLLTRSNAMIDGLRYRIRFPSQDELDNTGDQQQPIVEVERDPLEHPEEFDRVKAAWARDPVLKEGVRCARVRLGKPTVEEMLNEKKDQAAIDREEQLEQTTEEKFDTGFPPLIIEPDGTTEWVTFRLTDAPDDVTYDELDPEQDTVVDVIMDGVTGLVWLQRGLYPDELDMMQQHGWPPVLRQDFLTKTALTEDDVLEIRETRIRQ